MASTEVTTTYWKWFSSNILRNLTQTSSSCLWKSFHAILATTIFHNLSRLWSWSLFVILWWSSFHSHFLVLIWTTLATTWSATNLGNISFTLSGRDNTYTCFISSVFVDTILTALKTINQWKFWEILKNSFEFEFSSWLLILSLTDWASTSRSSPTPRCGLFSWNIFKFWCLS